MCCFASRSTRPIVTREQFIAEVWNGRIVTDEVLSRAVSLLRSVLEDDAQAPRFVRTVPRVGYALIAPVEALAPAKPAIALAASSKRVASAMAAAAAVLAALAGACFFRDAYLLPPDSLRLAVLPFASTGGGDAGLADGMTEDLTVSLARVPGIRVVARNSALRFKSGDADLAEAANALGASHILSGSVRETGERLRISVHLAEAESGTEIWAETYERGAGDLFALQADISKAVAETVRRRLPASAAKEAPPSNPEVYRLYLLGRQQLARRGEEGLRRAKRCSNDRWRRTRVSYAPRWRSLGLARCSRTRCRPKPPRPSPARTAHWPRLRVKRLCQERRRPCKHGSRSSATAGSMLKKRSVLDLRRRRMTPKCGYSTPICWARSAPGVRLKSRRSSRLATIRFRRSQSFASRFSRCGGTTTATRRPFLPRRGIDLAPSASPEVPMLLYARGGQFGQLEQALRELQHRRGQSDDWVSAVIAVLRDPTEGAAAEAALERAAGANQIDGLLHFGALVLGQRHERALRRLLERPRLHTQELEFTLLAREATDSADCRISRTW